MKNSINTIATRIEQENKNFKLCRKLVDINLSVFLRPFWNKAECEYLMVNQKKHFYLLE